MFHSARWDHDHDLNGRQVAVIGTGASAIQFVPEIQPQVGRLHLFQRTPPWVLPRGNPDIPRVVAAALRPTPAPAGRRQSGGVLAARGLPLRLPAPGRRCALAERRARDHIAQPGRRSGAARRSSPPTTAWAASGSSDPTPGIRRCVPTTSTSSRRRSPRSRPTRSSTVTASPTRSTRSSSAPAFRSPTRRSATVSAAATAGRWPRCGAAAPRPTSAIGVAGFPNLFMLLGPNTGLGHNSVLLMIEAQIAYLRQALSHRRRHGLATLEPTAVAQAAFIERGRPGHDGQRLDRRRLPELVRRRHRAQLDPVAGQRPPLPAAPGAVRCRRLRDHAAPPQPAPVPALA